MFIFISKAFVHCMNMLLRMISKVLYSVYLNLRCFNSASTFFLKVSMSFEFRVFGCNEFHILLILKGRKLHRLEVFAKTLNSLRFLFLVSFSDIANKPSVLTLSILNHMIVRTHFRRLCDCVHPASCFTLPIVY